MAPHPADDVLRRRNQGPILGDGGDRYRAAEADHLRVAHPVGGRKDHLVQGVQDGPEGHHDGLLGAAAGDDVVRGHLPPVVLLRVANNGGLHGWSAGGGCVTDLTGTQHGCRRQEGVHGSLGFGFSTAQVDQRLTFGLEDCGFLVQGEGGGLADGRGDLAYAHRFLRETEALRLGDGSKTQRGMRM